MSLFDQLVPRLSRREGDGNGSGATEYTVRPEYEIKETPEAWGLTVYLPGVSKDSLEITAEEGVLTVRGRRGWKRPEAWTNVWRESDDSPFELSLEHDNSVDVERVHAEIKDGILRLSLPKAEAVKPRKITVN